MSFIRQTGMGKLGGHKTFYRSESGAAKLPTFT